MKYITLVVLASLTFFACKNNSTNTESSSVTEVNQIDYPEAIDEIFDQHGTLALWKKMKTMSYEIVKENGNEKQIIDLQNRRERIEASDFTSGYDGKEYWVEADTTYKGNPKFYTNLMFYFYAMPFVLADEGIIFTKAEPITFEGTTYPGYRISYGEGIGVSPEDEYFIHYDAKTKEMAWLGYTVTFYSGKKSEKIKWIRYNDWKNFKGLKLPNSMTWYNVEDGKITEPRNTREFVNVTVNETKLDDSTFTKTAGARVVD